MRANLILNNLRLGGWGLRALDRNVSCLTALHTEAAGVIISADEIGRRAHGHWQEVFGLPGAFRAAEEVLLRQFAEE